MQQFEFATKKLQSRECTLAQARGYFDALAGHYGHAVFIPNPTMLAKFIRHLSEVESPLFEGAVIKVQQGNEHELTVEEADTIKAFLKTSIVYGQDAAEADVAEVYDITAIVDAERGVKKSRTDGSKYIDLDWIPPSSCEIERLFSQAKLIHTDHRRRMLPCNLEIVLFLKMNRHRWNAWTVQQVMTKYEEGHYGYSI